MKIATIELNGFVLKEPDVINGFLEYEVYEGEFNGSRQHNKQVPSLVLHALLKIGLSYADHCDHLLLNLFR